MKYIVILCLLLSSCMTYKKASNYILDTGQGAMFCAANFPVKDSVGEVRVTYRPADNTNYQNQIDSLGWSLYLLNQNMKQKEDILKDTGRCCDLVRQYVPIIDSLSNMSARLKIVYVPCLPDTVKIEIPIFTRDTAKELEATARATASQGEANMWQKIAIVCGIIAGILGFVLILKR